jgi:hypothetical protein
MKGLKESSAFSVRASAYSRVRTKNYGWRHSSVIRCGVLATNLHRSCRNFGRFAELKALFPLNQGGPSCDASNQVFAYALLSWCSSQ